MERNPQDLARLFPVFSRIDVLPVKYYNCSISRSLVVLFARASENRISQARFDSYLRILQAKD
jgi:hypothetical protein